MTYQCQCQYQCFPSIDVCIPYDTKWNGIVGIELRDIDMLLYHMYQINPNNYKPYHTNEIIIEVHGLNMGLDIISHLNLFPIDDVKRQLYQKTVDESIDDDKDISDV